MNLSAVESDDWRNLTDRIKRECARRLAAKPPSSKATDAERLLLIRRSRIAKKACAKPKLAMEVLKREYEVGQRWLIYCEDSDQLGTVIAELRTVGISAIEYHSGMSGDRAAALEWFRRFGGVIVSIRCLDEGVDIPDVSHALILASSQNPRQFIQRRGRVLRKAPNKTIAVLHDAIVVPVDLVAEPEQAALLRAEMVRAIEFSGSAINRAAGAQLRSIAMTLGINLDSEGDGGVEEDE